MPRLVEPVVPAGRLRAMRQPTLPAGPLLLRPWRAGYARAVVRAYSDPGIRQWHARSMDEADGDAEAVELIDRWRAAWAAETGASWAVTAVASGEAAVDGTLEAAVGGTVEAVIGRAALRDLDLDEGAAEVAYWVLPQARGNGVARTAVRALVGWAFDELGLHRLSLVHSVHNVASCRVALASGFSAEGTLRDAVLHPDGWHDMHLHARISSG